MQTIQRLLDSWSSQIDPVDKVVFQIDRALLTKFGSENPKLQLVGRFAWASFDAQSMKLEYLSVSSRKETRDPNHPLPEAQLLAIANRVIAAAGITDARKLAGIKTVSQGNSDQALATRFKFDRIYQGIPIPTVIEIELEQTTGRLTFFSPGEMFAPPPDVRPRLTYAQAKALSDMALISSTDVGAVELAKPTELRIRWCAFYQSAKYPYSDAGPAPTRLMYITQYRAPGYRLEGRFPSTELFDVYVDAITGDILAVTPPRGVISAPTEPRAAFDWKKLTGKGEFLWEKKKVSTAGLGFEPIGAELGKAGKRVLLKIGKSLTGLTFDPSQGLVAITDHGRTVTAKPNPATLKALRQLVGARA